MTRIGEPWQRCLSAVGTKSLQQQVHALERENGELVKDKETLTCALEYAKKDCAYWLNKHDAILLKFGQKLVKKRREKT